MWVAQRRARSPRMSSWIAPGVVGRGWRGGAGGGGGGGGWGAPGDGRGGCLGGGGGGGAGVPRPPRMGTGVFCSGGGGRFCRFCFWGGGGAPSGPAHHRRCRCRC